MLSFCSGGGDGSMIVLGSKHICIKIDKQFTSISLEIRVTLFHMIRLMFQSKLFFINISVYLRQMWLKKINKSFFRKLFIQCDLKRNDLKVITLAQSPVPLAARTVNNCL